MTSETILKAFPASSAEALAFLYVEKQDLAGKTPAEIQTMFYEALYEIRADFRQKNSSGWFKAKAEEIEQF